MAARLRAEEGRWDSARETARRAAALSGDEALARLAESLPQPGRVTDLPVRVPESLLPRWEHELSIERLNEFLRLFAGASPPAAALGGA